MTDIGSAEIFEKVTVESLWLDFQDYLKIPERIVLAGGWKKQECLRGILRGGLATTIVMDNITASDLLKSD